MKEKRKVVVLFTNPFTKEKAGELEIPAELFEADTYLTRKCFVWRSMTYPFMDIAIPIDLFKEEELDLMQAIPL